MTTNKFKIKLRNDYLAPKELPLSLSKEYPMINAPMQFKSYSLMSTTEKGDALVRSICNCLSSSDVISDIINISGISNHIFDIIVKTKKDGLLRGIQIKMLSKGKANDTWIPTITGCGYPDNTLMIFANVENTRFGIGLWKDICEIEDYLQLNFDRSDTAYELIKFNNITALKKQFEQLIEKAYIITDIRDGILSDGDKKEYDSLRNIKRICESNNIKFEYNYTNTNYIDIYLNNYPCQCKFTSHMAGKLYKCDLYQTSNSVRVPYNEYDKIAYFIFQLQDNNNPLKYKDDILIIPTHVSIKK